MARTAIPEENKKNHRINCYLRYDEKVFLENFLQERGITLRQLALTVAKYQPAQEYFNF
ncbi:hypothetical protein [Aeromonas sanarellii]|uniref:hypothetical protein n=1 Tax=Aeromonas sanarellii TaxID=633415 RepID=UPI0038CF33CA